MGENVGLAAKGLGVALGVAVDTATGVVTARLGRTGGNDFFSLLEDASSFGGLLSLTIGVGASAIDSTILIADAGEANVWRCGSSR